MSRLEDRLQLVERFCAREDLTTYDPYDIWKTPAGFAAKELIRWNKEGRPVHIFNHRVHQAQYRPANPHAEQGVNHPIGVGQFRLNVG